MAELTQGGFFAPPPPIQYRVRPDPVQNGVNQKITEATVLKGNSAPETFRVNDNATSATQTISIQGAVQLCKRVSCLVLLLNPWMKSEAQKPTVLLNMDSHSKNNLVV